MAHAHDIDSLEAPKRASLRLVLPPPTPYQRWGKRVLDVAVASAALVVAAPIMLISAAAIRLSMGSGVLYRQRRVGHLGEDFEMVKFRTMKHSRRSEQREWHGPDRRQTHKSSHDPRHTTIGRFLRKTSLDELPQLFQVLRGEMSLVGPRPELAEVVDRHNLRHHVRHSVRPGLTGQWQVSTRGSGKLLHECFDVDLEYVSDVTLKRDVSLLVQTVRVVARGS